MACFKSFVLLLLSYSKNHDSFFVGRQPYCHQQSQTTTQQHAFKNRLADVFRLPEKLPENLPSGAKAYLVSSSKSHATA